MTCANQQAGSALRLYGKALVVWVISSASPLLLAVLVAVSGCQSKASQAKEKASAAIPTTDSLRYPRGRWRLAPREALNHVVIWVSAILVRDRESDRRAPFEMGWLAEPPPPERSHEEAYVRATSLASQASVAPDMFDALARKYSDDVTTRDRGGSLGGLTMSHLIGEETILDALASLRPGEVSRVVPTRHGFVVLRRRAVPPLVKLAARRIVVRYDSLPTLTHRSPAARQSSGRSRAEALEIAQEVARKLRVNPALFDELLAQYASGDEALEGGDIGVWTNQEPGAYNVAREELAGLPIGGVTDPIDGPAGIQVFLRIEIPAMYVDYAVRVVKFPYVRDASPAAPAAQDSRESARREAESAITNVTRTSSQFEALAHLYCCDDPEHWSAGRTPPALIDAVASLSVNGVTEKPVDGGTFWAIVKRVDPKEGPPAVLFELPAPDTVDIDKLALDSSGTAVQRLVKGLAGPASQVLGLDPGDTSRVQELHAQLSEAFRPGESRATRQAAIAIFAREMRGTLSEPQWNRYVQFVRERMSARAMEGW